MKQITRCYGCNNLIRINTSYRAEITRPVKIPGTDMETGEWAKKEVKLCRRCLIDAGYKDRSKKDNNSGD